MTQMDLLNRLNILSNEMDVESDVETTPPPVEARAFEPRQKSTSEPVCPQDVPVYKACLPNGQKIKLLKTLLTSACERNCGYCPFRAGRNFRRETLKPEELAKSFMLLYQGGAVEGLFLSSGVAGGGIVTQDRLLATAEILRKRYMFRGYLHLKVMPGSQQAQVEQAMRLADRVSVNLEAPTIETLSRLAPQKVLMEELLKPLRWVEEIRHNMPAWKGWNARWPSSTTQFVVGAAGETDGELLKTSDYLIHRLGLTRVYYSGFKPVIGTPLENLTAVNPWRQNRLYQASFLLRDYGFRLDDLSLVDGFLPLEVDPKLFWAQQNLNDQPVELSRADYLTLLRVPGIGPHTAREIISARRQGCLNHPEDLRRLGLSIRRAAPFILLNGRSIPNQPRLL
jgi:predicted DNA-binding helix-hairpin-helix protein